jgi:hypothetical protein
MADTIKLQEHFPSGTREQPLGRTVMGIEAVVAAPYLQPITPEQHLKMRGTELRLLVKSLHLCAEKQALETLANLLFEESKREPDGAIALRFRLLSESLMRDEARR